MSLGGSGLEIRWRVESPHGRLVASVQVDDGTYFSSLIDPPANLAGVESVTGKTADEVLDALMLAVGGRDLVPLGARPSNRY